MEKLATKRDAARTFRIYVCPEGCGTFRETPYVPGVGSRMDPSRKLWLCEECGKRNRFVALTVKENHASD